jgi:hypothetical protein
MQLITRLGNADHPEGSRGRTLRSLLGANWGRNRSRLEPADIKTRHACMPIRSGFYLHDSTKGFSHGCIEVEGRFFTVLRSRVPSHSRAYFILKVKYAARRATNGGTRE